MKKPTMKYLYLPYEINEDFVNKLGEFLSQEGEKRIYINSGGGKMSDCRTAIDMIDSQKENITLVASGEIMSAAFYLFYKVKCKKYLAESCAGMHHQPTITVDIAGGNGNLDNAFDKYKKKRVKSSYRFQKKMHKDLGFTKKELKRINKNYNVYFSPKRMKELFKDLPNL